MPEPTKANATTSEEEGKNSEGKAEGADTQTAKTEDADKKFTQADLDRIAAKVRDEEKTKAKTAAEEAERKRKETEDEEQKKFEKLAADRKTRIDELEPQVEALTAERDKYRAQVADLASSELAALPQEVRDIAPAQYGEDKSLTNPLDVLAWLPKGKALAAKLDATPAKPGAGHDPKPRGDNGKVNEQARLSQRRAIGTTF